MRTSTRFSRPFVALLFFAVLLAGQAQAQHADVVLRRLKAKYDTLESLRASFSQTMTSAYSDQASTFSGTLVLKGNRYRVETDAQTLVTDGVTTWLYDESENQVLINDYIEDETAFSPGDFLMNFDQDYNVTAAQAVRLEGQPHFKLSLKPKSRDSFFREATLWMRDRDDVVTRLEVLDVNETKMMFSLKNIELNPAIPAKAFTFTAPKGAEVYDLRS